MSLETLSGGSYKSVSTLSDGEKIEGFLKGVVKERNKFDNEQYNLLLTDDTGSEFKVLTGGTAKYFAQNIAVAMGLEKSTGDSFAQAIGAAKRAIGKWIIITPDGTYENKRKQTVKKFKIQLDSSRSEGCVGGITGQGEATTPDDADVPF